MSGGALKVSYARKNRHGLDAAGRKSSDAIRSAAPSSDTFHDRCVLQTVDYCGVLVGT